MEKKSFNQRFAELQLEVNLGKTVENSYASFYYRTKEQLNQLIKPIAIKHGITVINSPGTVDADYRGEICVELVNLSNTPFTVEPGERIAQLVFSKYEKVDFVEVEELSKTERGTGGIGHTGLK